jgi:hypothetical protein
MTDSRYKGEISNALVETVGFDGLTAAYDRCTTSARFAVLEAIASHGNSQWSRLVKAVAKVAKNPNTRASL